ncbi:MAG: phosphatase PAP2 family protein [Pseudomonadota bacterium]
MMTLQFNQSWLIYIADNRPEFATKVFQAFSFLGGMEGYLIVIALLYSVISKRLAVLASIVALVSMIANHLLKILIHNPRPFTVDGTYLDYWAVSPEHASELLAEFSTPSGHAMTAAAFYGFLLFRAKGLGTRVLLLLIPLLIGLSRPVIGVHYVEDILLGWLLGGGCALLAARRVDFLWDKWQNVNVGQRAAIVVVFSIMIWTVTLLATGRQPADLPTEFVGVLGFLSGVMLAAPIEERSISYQTHSISTTTKAIRFVLMLILLIATTEALDAVTPLLGDLSGIMQNTWRYARYTVIGVVGVLFVPLLFVRLRLAQTGID